MLAQLSANSRSERKVHVIPNISARRLHDPGMVRDMLAAFKTVGAIALTDVDWDSARALTLFQIFWRMVAQYRKDPSTLQRYIRPDLWHQTGFTPPNTEKAVLGNGEPDFKACWFCQTRPHESRAEYRPLYPELYPDNVWPDEAADVSRFREAYSYTGTTAHDVGSAVLAAMEQGLQLAPGELSCYFIGGPHISRLLAYLELTADQVGTGILWSKKHTDFNGLTVLPFSCFLREDGEPVDYTDDQCGLGIYAVDGTTVRAIARKGAMLIQLGQALEVLTGGELVATPHEVRAPTVPGLGRGGFAHFMHLSPLTMLRPLHRFRTAQTDLRYAPPVLSGTRALATLEVINLAPKGTLLERCSYRYDRVAQFRGGY